MAEQLTDLKTAEGLAAAQTRQTQGTANATDLANLQYATTKYGMSDFQGAYQKLLGSTFNPNDFMTNPAVDPANGTDTTITGQSAAPTPQELEMPTTKAIADAKTQLEKQISDYKAEQDRIRTQQKADELAAGGTVENIMGGVDTVQQQEEAKLTDTFNQLSETEAQIEQAMGELKIAKAGLASQVIPMDFIVGQQALLEEQAMGRVAILQSKAALLSKRYDFARQIMESHIENAWRKAQVRIDNLNRIKDYAREDLIRLSDKEEKALETSLNLEIQKAQELQANRDKILELMIQNPEAWAKSGLKGTETYAQMVQKMTEWLSKNPAGEKAIVSDLITKYPDAGIQLTDSLATAQAKLSSSKIYAQQTRLAGSGGGGGGITPTTPTTVDPLIKKFVYQDEKTGEWVVDGEEISNTYSTGKDAAEAKRQALIYADQLNASAGGLTLEVLGEGTGPLGTKSGGLTGAEKFAVEAVGRTQLAPYLTTAAEMIDKGYLSDAISSITKWFTEPQ